MPRKRAKPRRKAPERIPVGPAPRVKYADRPRDTPRMCWVKAQPCCAALSMRASFPSIGPCEGVTEADHAGAHGMGNKADDDTVIPLCVRHHRAPGLAHLLYGHVEYGWLREWKDRMIARFRARWEAHRLGVSP